MSQDVAGNSNASRSVHARSNFWATCPNLQRRHRYAVSGEAAATAAQSGMQMGARFRATLSFMPCALPNDTLPLWNATWAKGGTCERG